MLEVGVQVHQVELVASSPTELQVGLLSVVLHVPAVVAHRR